MATHGHSSPSDSPSFYGNSQGYFTDGESSQKALSEKTISEFVVSPKKKDKLYKDIEGLRPYRPPSAMR